MGENQPVWPPEVAVVRLTQLKEEGQKLLGEQRFSEEKVEPWRNAVLASLEQAFGTRAGYFMGAFVNWQTRVLNYGADEEEAYARDAQRAFPKAINTLESAIRQLTLTGTVSPASAAAPPAERALPRIQTILKRVHAVAVELRKRQRDRAPFLIGDEYDVQDLLRALLRLAFDDIRPEEWTPSYAGKAARIDFLLKQEQVVIEAKMTNEKLSGKEIGEQLIIDIARYTTHPGCKHLVCFVYDPDHRITNPVGLESDLSRIEGGVSVEVMVEPKLH